MFVKTHWLDAVTATGTSEVVELEGVFRFAIEVSWTGSPDLIEGKLQGSITGEKWRDLSNFGGPNSSTDTFTQNSTCHPIRFLRLTLDTLTGGTSPTVTVSVVGTEVISTVSSWDA